MENVPSMTEVTHVTLEAGVTYLCRTQVANFYAYVFNALERVIVPGYGTFGVASKGTRYCLYVDPDMIDRICFDELVATLEHEVLHIVLDHIPREMRLYQLCETDQARRLFVMFSNLAMDLAANCILRRTHPKIADPDQPLGYWALPKARNYPEDLSYEEYLLRLIEDNKSDVAKMDRVWARVSALIKDALEAASGGAPDPTSPAAQLQMLEAGKGGGEPLEDPEEEALAQALAESMKKNVGQLLQDYVDPARADAVHQNGVRTVRSTLASYKKTRGTLPGNLEELLANFLRPPAVRWADLYAGLVASLLTTKPVRGMQRVSMAKAARAKFLRNKRAALASRLPLVPGTMRDRKFRVVFVEDTSGSMGMEDLAEGMNELHHMREQGVDLEVLVLHIDTRVAKEYWLGDGDEIDYTMCGRGGTDFEIAFAYVKKLIDNGESFDFMTYATDGYAPKPRTTLPFPTIWLITAKGQEIMANEPNHITLRTQNVAPTEV